MAVLTGKHPQMIKPLLAYQTMIVREACRCGGNGWLAYDTYFRQKVAGDPEADWSCLNTLLYAVTFLGQGGKGGQSCTTCMETDHTQYVSRHRSQLPTLAKRAYLSSSREPVTADRGKCRSTGTSCFAWTQGECQYPQCRYRHTCLHCSGEHPMTRCQTLLQEHEGQPDRDYRSPRGGPRGSSQS